MAAAQAEAEAWRRVKPRYDAQEGLREELSGRRWLWMGTCFVTADQVAFSAPANAAPYLYTIPPDLACFSTLLRNFGVRKTFGTSDWVQVLRIMATETGVVSGGGGGSASSGEPRALSASQLALALSLVQALSDDTMRVADLEVFAPDETNELALATDLVYNDAPWLAKNKSVEGFRFVHPKISAGVGDKVGIRSLRLLLATSHAADMDFGLEGEGGGDGQKVKIESLGQSESLTRRLRHILELYPEGPSILSELIQNADDARATTVKVLYNTREYGTKSLLGPKMAAWQGPALCVYNDATFSARDFQNLVKIGQASKLDRLVTVCVQVFPSCPSLTRLYLINIPQI